MSDYSNVITLTGHTGYVISVAFSPDGNYKIILFINRKVFSISIMGLYYKVMEDVRLFTY